MNIFDRYEDFNTWLNQYIRQGGKMTDRIEISVENIIYESPLEVAHAFEE